MKKLLSVIVLFSGLSLNALAQDANWMVRMRAITVNPDESGSPTVVGGKANISNESVPEVDFSYFFTSNFALELILATATHDVSVVGASSNTTGLDLGSVSLLPPTLLAQYHFYINKLKPYLGLGINYTHFYGVKPGAMKSVDYDDSVGYAFQGGLDYEIESNWFVNFDVKKLMLATDLTATTYADVTVKADVDINPWIVGVGLGRRF